MVDKVNGHVAAGEALGRNLDFFIFSGPVNILPTSAGGDATSQANLDKLVEVISLRGQPVILGTPANNSGTYTVKFATEHTGAWTAADLKAAAIAHSPAFMAANASLITVTITSEL